jgi:hypothetical protein
VEYTELAGFQLRNACVDDMGFVSNTSVHVTVLLTEIQLLLYLEVCLLVAGTDGSVFAYPVEGW